MTASLEQPIQIIRQTDLQDPSSTFAQDVQTGLTETEKKLSSVYFYDEEGSLLFERICDLDEYYLTRKETEILKRKASEIISELHPNSHLIELGSGSSTKTRILIEAALKSFGFVRYSPIDISEEMLTHSAESLIESYDSLEIEAVAGLYEFGLEQILQEHISPKCVMWLGSSIGNLTRAEATDFLRDIRQQLAHHDRILLGIDLRKSREILEPAYDDAEGVTAAFNMNLLKRLNRELDSHFDLDAFKHRARYNVSEGRIEMYLDSLKDQRVNLTGLDTEIHLDKDESILTEYSYKYSVGEIRALADRSGFEVQNQWLDQDKMFSLTLFKPKP